jgi:hypothetical protein
VRVVSADVTTNLLLDAESFASFSLFYEKSMVPEKYSEGREQGSQIAVGRGSSGAMCPSRCRHSDALRSGIER